MSERSIAKFSCIKTFFIKIEGNYIPFYYFLKLPRYINVYEFM